MKLKKLIHRFGNIYIKQKCKQEFISQKYKWINERPTEYSFVFKYLANNKVVDILDIGTGTTGLPSILRTCGYLVTATDNIKDYWPKGMVNRHYHVMNDDILDTQLEKKYDLITCISVLEHIKDFDLAVNNMFMLLKPNGSLILTFPYNENKYIDNVYKLAESSYGPNNPFICQVFSRNELNKWLEYNSGNIKEQEYWQIFEGEYWTIGKHVYPFKKVVKENKHQLTCLVITRND